VVGSSGVVKFQTGADGKPELMKLAKIEFVERRPRASPSASTLHRPEADLRVRKQLDGDCRCCNGTKAGTGARFAGIVHHTDEQCVNTSMTGLPKLEKLDKALDQAMATGLDHRRHEAGLEDGVS